MTLITLFQWSKSLHRLALFGVVGLAAIMGLTGMLLKFPKAARFLPGVDLNLVRYLHNEFSLYFSLFLITMILTGLYMYWYPWYAKRRASQKVPPTPQA